MKHLNEEELVLFYYREPELAAASRRHVSECGQCRAAADALARTLDVCLEWEPPAAPPDLARSVWAQIAPALEAQPRPRRPWVMWGMAFAAMLVMAFALGRFTVGAPHRGKPALMTGLSQQARQRILQISLADHLDRTGMLLTEIANTTDIDGLERERAHDLVGESRLMRQMAGIDHSELLDDVERLLLDVANATSPSDEVRHRIASESLIFKVHITESNLRTQGKKS